MMITYSLPRKDVYGAFSELSTLHIEHHDIRYDNILRVADDGIPSLASPYTGRKYPCRIIDLEIARKIASTPEGITLTMNVAVSAALYNLPHNSFWAHNID